MYDPDNMQVTSPTHANYFRGYRIIFHSLYESGQLPHRVRLTSAIGSIHMLWRPVAHYTVDILSRKPTSHFTTTWVNSCANRIIVHPLFGSVQSLAAGHLPHPYTVYTSYGPPYHTIDYAYHPENEKASSPHHACG